MNRKYHSKNLGEGMEKFIHEWSIDHKGYGFEDYERKGKKYEEEKNREYDRGILPGVVC
jgi:hypothetical protein